KAEQAMEQFSDLIRYSFHNEGKYQSQSERGRVSLEKEWEICKKYLELERLRLGDNLRLFTDIDPNALRFKSPQLLLQPLIENAIIHGVANNECGGDIEIKINNDKNKISINVVNSLEKSTNKIERDTSGLGLLAVKASLESAFGTKAALRTEVIDDISYHVEIIMPAEELKL
ncbi:MAG: histidine kinase, partial [Emcibacteraceae bacterium]|nr:histidine kinase [Emcibacteraceae bacterium]